MNCAGQARAMQVRIQAKFTMMLYGKSEYLYMLFKFIRKRLLPWLFWSVLFCLGASAWAHPFSGHQSSKSPEVPPAWVELSEDAYVSVPLPETAGELTIKVLDPNGQALANRYWQDGTQVSETLIPIRGWVPGTYAVHIRSGDKQTVRLLMVRE